MLDFIFSSTPVTQYCNNPFIAEYTDGNKRSGVRLSTAKGRGRFLELYPLKDGKVDVWAKDLALLLALTGAMEKDVKVHEKDTLKYSIRIAEDALRAMNAAPAAKKAEPKAKAAPAKKTAAKKTATTKR